MAALIECELAAYNKPNLYISMAFTHTVILTSTTSPMSANPFYLHKYLQNLPISKIQNGTWGLVSAGHQVPIQMTAR